MFVGKKFSLKLFLCALALVCLAFVPTVSVHARNTGHYVDEDAFFAKVRKIMHRRGMGDIQFQTYKQLINYWNSHPNITDRRWLAYVMATAYHETQLKPVREGFKKTDAAARKHVRWMWNKRIITLPYHRPDPVTGQVYYGRGYVQLTWAQNYKKMGRAIGMGDQLYLHPDLVLDPEIASKVLFVGMLKGKFRYSKRRAPKGWQKLRLFFNKNRENWYGARNIINGDLRKNGKRVAGYGRKYASAIRFRAAPPVPPVNDDNTEATPGEGEVVPTLPGTDVADGGGGTPDGEGSAPATPTPQTPKPEKPVPDSSGPDTPSSGPVSPEAPSPDTPSSDAGNPVPSDVPANTPDSGTPTGDGEAGDSSGDPVDTAGEVTPSLPDEGEIVPDTPETPKTPDVAETPATPDTPTGEPVSNDPVEGDGEVLPMGNEQPEVVTPAKPTESGGPTTGPDTPTEADPPIVTTHPQEPDVPAEPAQPAEPQAPATPDTPEVPIQVEPDKPQGWWGTIKSYLARAGSYIWKF